MAKFKVILERTDTIIKQAAMMVDASTAEEARQIILGDLEVDAGSYDDDLQPVDEGIGDMTVTVEKQHEPAHVPRSLAS
jgi:5,10-methylene-tetrahydrofolate dehydrogenase/methenyl tetrahydrofolate cyclohydrolase